MDAPINPEDKTSHSLVKAPTGIIGFDEITFGGLPAGRPTLVCGAAGCGKSLFGAEFLVRGVREFDENGVLMTFEESASDILTNVDSLGFGMPELIRNNKIAIDHVVVDRHEMDVNGEFDLEGIFVRLAYAIESVGAKRVVLDTIETLFSGFSNQAILRSELRRLFGWLKERGMTTVITGERGDGTLTRQGLEEYVSDCVVLLDHRVTGQISTRRLRVVKYRGSAHRTNEFPFLIDSEGMSVLPITEASLDYDVSNERVPTGIKALNQMLDGGYYSGSCILLSGTAGTGKSTIAAYLAKETCERGSRCMYFSFEESPRQILRNMETVGADLKQHIAAGNLEIKSSRPTSSGLEMHLVKMHKSIEKFKPDVVIIDPISNLHTASNSEESSQMLLRLVDILRSRRITTFLINLTRGGTELETSGEDLSSMVDTWLLVRSVETNGERNRVMYILKSRGMAHSNQLREFVITPNGIDLIPAYLGEDGVLTGSARLLQEQRDQAKRQSTEDEQSSKRLQLVQKERALAAQMEALKIEHYAVAKEMEKHDSQKEALVLQATLDAKAMSVSRHHES